MAREDLLKRDAKLIWHPYTQHQAAHPPLAVSAARGASLFDEDGRSYLDMISSWWVNLHGHGCKELTEAIAAQAERLDHVHFAGVTHEPAVALAEQLLALAGLEGGGRVFYSDNGSTAVEVALKICCQFWRNAGEIRNALLAFRRGYHGDTLGAMSVGGASGFFKAFEPWMLNVEYLEAPSCWWNSDSEEEEQRSLAHLENLLHERSSQFCGFIVEPLVQGAAGMQFHRPEFLLKVCQRVRAAGLPVIFDEVMTGFYRTGSAFAFLQCGFTPDLVCLSKGLTGGILPLGATIASPELFAAFLGESFDLALAHGHSFTGNPISCSAALASIALLKKNDAGKRVAEISRCLAQNLAALINSTSAIEKPRVLGGIAAFELKTPTPDYASAVGRPLAVFAQKRGVILRPLGNVVYLMPPYCTTDSEIATAFEVVRDYLETL
jgi:adenosylmethionine-8-amino-7-oxononanoate aminotransferase